MLRITNLIDSFKWNTIIILDACRYDYYKMFRDCLLGISPGKDTCTSIPKMFPKKYNAVYISANPYINSLGGHEMLKGWIPKEHFIKIIDVWKDGWNDELGTVDPEYVVEKALYYQKHGFRAVIHFMQPHAPYVLGSVKVDILQWRNARNEVLGINTDSEHEDNKHVDLNTLKRAYKENLRVALYYMEKCINGNTIILSDHGECLGEHGYIGHSANYICDILNKVPVEVIC